MGYITINLEDLVEETKYGYDIQGAAEDSIVGRMRDFFAKEVEDFEKEAKELSELLEHYGF